MRIGHNRRLRFSRRCHSPAVWFGVFAAAAAWAGAPAIAQQTSGASMAASVAAAAATNAAPAPKMSAATVAAQAAEQGNSAMAPAEDRRTASNDPHAAPPQATEEAAFGADPPAAAAMPVKADAGPPLTGIALQCANLLKLATSLKTEVDKTTKDVLSVSVVRDAGQIERMAKKMRAEKR